MSKSSTPVESGRNIVTGPKRWNIAFLVTSLAAVLAIAGWIAILTTGTLSPAQDVTHAAGKSDRLVVTFLDVSDGDSALISTPGGKYLLIDAGRSSGEHSTFDGGIDVVLPYLKAHRVDHLDMMIGTHPHNDHIGGFLSILQNFPVTTYADPGMPYTAFAYEKLLLMVKEKGMQYVVLRDMDTIDLDPALHIQVLGPRSLFSGTNSDPNNNSVVLRLKYREISFLFCGDIEREAERDLIGYGTQLRSTFLKVPHHGSNTSSSDALLAAVDPKIAYIPCGYRNRHGHPSPEVVKRYQDRGIRLLRQDKDGTTTVVTDGYGYRVFTTKNGDAEK